MLSVTSVLIKVVIEKSANIIKYMRNEKKNNVSLLLSIVAIVMSMGIIVLWIVSTNNLAVVSLDSFVGVIVALLAILVTTVLGWQIYNAIEIKEKLRAIDSLQSALRQQEHRMEQMYCHACHSHGYVAAYQSASVNNDFVDAYRWLMSSLRYSLLLDEPINVEKVLDEMLELAKRIPSHSTLDKEIFAEIEEDYKVITNAPSFNCISLKFKQTHNIFLPKVTPV